MSFTTWNPSNLSGVTLSGGNLIATGNTGASSGVLAIDGQYAGLYYFETSLVQGGITSNVGLGLAMPAATGPNTAGGGAGAVYYKTTTGAIFVDGVSTVTGLTGNPSTLDVAVNFTSKLAWFRPNNGNWNGSPTANPATGVGGVDISGITGAGLFPIFCSDTTSDSCTANFGASAFSRTVPSGYTSGWPVGQTNVAIDAAACRSALKSGGTSTTFNVTTSGTNRIVMLLVSTEKSGGAPTVSTLSDTAGLTWTRRKLFQYATSNGLELEIWWALAATALTADTITITWSAAIDDATLATMAMYGTNVSLTAPFDADVSLPATASGSSTSPSVTGMAVSGEAIVFSLFGAGLGQASGGAVAQGSGYGLVANIRNGGGGLWSFLTVGAQYHSAAASGLSASTAAISSTSWGMVGDAVSGAVLELDLPAASPALAASMAAAITLELDFAASFALGFTSSDLLTDINGLSASPALGATMAVTPTVEQDLVANNAVGLAMAASVVAVTEVDLVASMVLGFDTASVLTEGAFSGVHSVGMSMGVVLAFEQTLSPHFSLGLGEALSPGLITLPGKDILISWLRRDRLGGSPRFVQDTVPMSEAVEKYDVEILIGNTVVRSFLGLTTNSVTYTAVQQIADGWTYPPIQLSVRVFQLSAVVGRGFGEIIMVNVT